LPARETPSKGSKPDKLMRDALILELHQEAVDADGVMTKKLRLVARALVDAGTKGDVPAIKEINDRVDGKAPQVIQGDEDNPLVFKEADAARDIIAERIASIVARAPEDRDPSRLN
jgi:hypothetical protein